MDLKNAIGFHPEESKKIRLFLTRSALTTAIEFNANNHLPLQRFIRLIVFRIVPDPGGSNAHKEQDSVVHNGTQTAAINVELDDLSFYAGHRTRFEG